MTQMILLIIGLTAAASMAVAFYWNNVVFKLLVLTTYAVLASAVYFSLDSVKGWPAEEKREVRGTLASVVIINPSEKGEGAIIISLFPTGTAEWYEYEYPRYAPKTFYLKYSNDRAAQFEAAKQALIDGKEVRINGIPPETNANGGQEGEGEASTIQGIIGKYLEKILPKQGDTYRPEIPDVEILTPDIPPQKGTN